MVTKPKTTQKVVTMNKLIYKKFETVARPSRRINSWSKMSSMLEKTVKRTYKVKLFCNWKNQKNDMNSISFL